VRFFGLLIACNMLGYHSVAVVPNVALICRMHH
jgi:hypothetical protein